MAAKSIVGVARSAKWRRAQISKFALAAPTVEN
jgi:hypothetical protein